MAQVIIYTTPTCGFCHMEKEWLKEKGIDFVAKDITKDEQAFNEAQEKAGQPVVPITDIDGTIIIGFDRPQLEEALKKAELLK